MRNCIKEMCSNVAFYSQQELVHLFRQRVFQFNACVPYSGVSLDARIDAAVLPVLFTLLPLPQPVGITVAPPSAKVSLERSIPAFAVFLF